MEEVKKFGYLGSVLFIHGEMQEKIKEGYER